jgi:hypothetical protein
MLDGVAESWLEIVIERRTGGDGGADTHLDDLDDLDADDLDADEPRVITVTGYGPRWAGTPFGSAS